MAHLALRAADSCPAVAPSASTGLSELEREPLMTPDGQQGWVYWRSGRRRTIATSQVTIGQFDGVHRGHRSLIAQSQVGRDCTGATVGALTFDRHPKSLLAPAGAPRTLTRLDDKVRLLLSCGLDFVAVLTVSHELLGQTPARFVDSVLVSALAVRRVVVGANFRFGRGASGDPVRLAELGEAGGFDVVTAALRSRAGDVVSSSRIRSDILHGDVAGASALLGRPHAVRALVEGVDDRGLSLVTEAGAAVPGDGAFRAALGAGRHGLTEPGGRVSVLMHGTELAASPRDDSRNHLSPGDEVTVHFLSAAPDRRDAGGSAPSSRSGGPRMSHPAGCPASSTTCTSR
jgi:riboflavin kinase/FMN adenylyltransferase